MSKAEFPGHGRKRPQRDLRITQLHLDSENPRLPEEAQGKTEPQLRRTLYEKFFLDEIAESMARNGYFDEEPLVAIPQKLPAKLKKADPNSPEFGEFISRDTTQFTVVEGNRRLATAQLLLDAGQRVELRIKHWPSISDEVADDLRVLPAIIYPTRAEVIPYLGVRHIVGIQKWESYAKARYIAKMVEVEGRSLKEVGESMGDRQGSVNKNYLCYRMLAQAADAYDLDLRKAKDDFSLLLLAVGQGNIKRFLGLPKKTADTDFGEPVPQESLSKLKNLISWVFGDGRYSPVIKESRDITNFLSHIVASVEALAYLEANRDLDGAYDRTDGEEKMVLRYLATANTKLESALGIAHRHKTFEVISQVEKCEQTVKSLLKTVREEND